MTASPTPEHALSLSLGEEQPPLEVTPLVPKSRTSACLDLSSVAMHSAWQQVEANFLCGDNHARTLQQGLALDAFWNNLHSVVDKDLECPAVSKDVHKKCRCAGVPLCKDNNLAALKAHVTRAFRDICQSQSKDAPADNKIDKELKQRLSNGHWVLVLHGEAIDPPSDGKGGDGMMHEFLWLHISHVLGGLQQFYPLFTRMVLHLPESGVVMTDDGLVWPETAELHVGLGFGGTFCDYTEVLQNLDVDKQWSLHIYELADSQKYVGTLKPGQIEVVKAKKIPPYVAWKGAAAYKRSSRVRKPSKSKAKQDASLALFDLEPDAAADGGRGQSERIPGHSDPAFKDRAAQQHTGFDEDAGAVAGDDFDPFAFPDDDSNDGDGDDALKFLWDFFCNEDDEKPEADDCAAATMPEVPVREPSSGSREPSRAATAEVPVIPDDTPLEMFLPGAALGKRDLDLDQDQDSVPPPPPRPNPDDAEQPRQPRRPGYVGVFMDVPCSQCGNVAGQIKLDPGPGGRDKKTWFMRVKEADGSRWADKFPKFRRRVVTVFGETDAKPKEWVQENRHCCRG